MKLRTALALLFVLLAASMLSLAIGAVPLSLGEVWTALTGSADGTSSTIVRQLRLPRTVLGALVGAALGVSGATLQTTLRNPLAEPYLLGVSGGAAVGAVVATVAGLTAIGAISVFAFAGALAAVAVVLLLAATTRRGRDPLTLLMAGVVTGAFCNAVIMVALARAPATAQRGALWWMMGSIATAGWDDVAWLAGAVIVLGGTLLHLSRQLDALALGAETAVSLGVDADVAARRFFLVASLLAAATVSTAGLIGFAGLIVPHIARAVTGRGSTRAILIAAALLGASLVLASDIAARSIMAPSELPLGAVTAILGVPFFLWQLRRGAVR